MTQVHVDVPPTSLSRAEVLESIPSDSTVRYFPGATAEGGHDGVIVRITPKEERDWVGMFGYGYRSPVAVSCVLGLPASEKVYVVAAGQGYQISAHAPDLCEKITCFPIIDARRVESPPLVLFVDFIQICAYDKDGLRWKTERISSDGITLSDINSETVQGVAWDAPTQRHVNFRVRLHDGAVRFEQ